MESASHCLLLAHWIVQYECGNLKTGEAASKPFGGHMSPVGSISFSPDGEYIASSSKDRTIRVWNSKTGEVTWKLIGNYNKPISISFSPDGKYTASASGSVSSNSGMSRWAKLPHPSRLEGAKIVWSIVLHFHPMGRHSISSQAQIMVLSSGM
jgi:WD40 repeat protein